MRRCQPAGSGQQVVVRLAALVFGFQQRVERQVTAVLGGQLGDRHQRLVQVVVSHLLGSRHLLRDWRAAGSLPRIEPRLLPLDDGQQWGLCGSPRAGASRDYTCGR